MLSVKKMNEIWNIHVDTMCTYMLILVRKKNLKN